MRRRSRTPIDHHPSVRQVLEHYGIRVYSGPRNGWARALCPFHDDRTPSAAVHDVHNLFYCFTCSISTTALGIVMRRENLDLNGARDFARDTFGTDHSVVSDVHGERGREGLRATRQRARNLLL